MKKLWHIVYVVLLGIGLNNIVLAADTATTIDVNISWIPNTEVDLAGYKVYRSLVPGEYGAPIAILDKTKNSYLDVILRGITDQRYFYTLTAYDTADVPRPGSNPPYIPSEIPNESAKSNEVSKLIAAIATIPKPGIPVLSVVSEAPGEITVTWPDVSDGVGGKAKVNIRYGTPSMQWGVLTNAVCETSPCKIVGVLPDTFYGVRGVAYRVGLDGKNIFGTITSEVQVMTLPIVDEPPSPPQGIIISKETEEELVVIALVEDCKELTTSAVGTTETVHKLTTRCVK